MPSQAGNLTVTPTRFADAVLIQPRPFTDQRGFFKETYVRSKYEALGIRDDFAQDSVSFSTRGVLRGLHCDLRMSKLVQVLWGEVYDVIVDARKESPTFGQWQGFHFEAEHHTQLYVPSGFLHGFLTLSSEAVFSYKQSEEYDPSSETGVCWDDPILQIAWPLHAELRVSAKDAANQSFRSAFMDV